MQVKTNIRFVGKYLYIIFSRWILTPYLVVIWASSAIYDKKKDVAGIPDGIINYVLAIIIIAVITLVVRLGLIGFRTFHK